MKLGNIRRLFREDLPDAPKGEWLDTVLQVMNQANEQTTQGLQGGLTTAANTTSGYGVYRFVHGQELTIRNPLKVRPVGIQALRVVAAPGGAAALPVAGNPLWRFIDGPDPKAPQQLGITVQFAPPFGGARLRQSVATPMPVGATHTMVFNVIESVFGAITANNNSVTCNADGLIDMSAQWSMLPGTVGQRSAWIQRVAGGAYRVASTNGFPPDAAATPISINVSVKAWRASAGHAFSLQSFFSGPAGPINTDPGTAEPQLQIQYVAPPIGYSADVILRFDGG